jgi:hypothetical protein
MMPLFYTNGVEGYINLFSRGWGSPSKAFIYNNWPCPCFTMNLHGLVYNIPTYITDDMNISGFRVGLLFCLIKNKSWNIGFQSQSVCVRGLNWIISQTTIPEVMSSKIAVVGKQCQCYTTTSFLFSFFLIEQWYVQNVGDEDSEIWWIKGRCLDHEWLTEKSEMAIAVRCMWKNLGKTGSAARAKSARKVLKPNTLLSLTI